MTLSVGSRLGPYEILAPLGAGGMGEVTALGKSPICHTFATLGAAESPGQRENAVLTRVS
jgi:hypothetical protein